MITRYNSYHLDDNAQVYLVNLAKQLLEKETLEDNAAFLKGYDFANNGEAARLDFWNLH